jgi:hypothetical protein
MKRILALAAFCAVSFAQNGGVIPPPDIANTDVAGAAQRAYRQGVEAQQIRQQTRLLKEQTDALKRQNALMEQQQKAALVAQDHSQQFIPAARKPRIDDIDAATGKPRFATFADYEDAKDEWLIEEAMRRFEALHAK